MSEQESRRQPLGMYGLRQGSDTAFCTQGLYELLGVPPQEQRGSHCPKEYLRQLLDSRLGDPDDGGLCRVALADGEHYLLHRCEKMGGSVIGTVLDVTEA